MRIDRYSRNPAIYLVLGVLCLFLAGYCVVYAAPSFSQRTIGIAILHGQNPSTRNLVYVLAIMGSVLIFLSAFLRFRLAPPEQAVSTALKSNGWILCAILIANTLLYFHYEASIFLTAIYALVYLFGLGLLFRYIETRGFNSDFSWILAALVFQGMAAAGAVGGVHLQFGVKYFVVFTSIMAALLWLSRLVLKKYLYINTSTLGHVLLPLMLIPLAVIAANEIQYSISNLYQYSASASLLWSVLIVGIVVAAVFRYFRVRAHLVPGKKTDDVERTHWLLVARYIPLILVTSVAFCEYTDTVNFFAYQDFFHGGEATVPTQQILQFGSIPYIDFYPTHGFFDFLPQLFYQMANQQEYVEAIGWGEGYVLGWLPRMLAIAAMYWLLRIFLGYGGAFLVLAFLPTYHMFHPYYVLLIIPLFAINLSRSTFVHWLMFWFLLLLVFLWRIDFGIAALAAGLFMLMSWFWTERSGELLWRCIVAAVIVVALVVVAFSVLSASRGKSAVSVVQQIFLYIQVQTPLSAHEKIVSQIDVAAALQYVLLPVIGALTAAYILSVALRREQITRQMLVLAFLSAASLVISVRSLNRHSHFEGVFNPYFFVLLAALLPVVMFRLSRAMNVTIFVAVCVGTYIFLPKSSSAFVAAFYKSTLQQQYLYSTAAQGAVSLSMQAPPETRLKSNNSGAQDTVSFLRDYLQGDETFHDFTNSPLLYALSDKKFPGFIMETFFHTSEEIQGDLIHDLDILYQQDNLPIVLFRNMPDSSPWNRPDGVDSAVRSYRVVEYIYRHYLPCAQIGRYDIWLAKNRKQSGDCASDLRKSLEDSSVSFDYSISASSEPVQQFDIVKLPYVWANYDTLTPAYTCSSGHKVEVYPQEDPESTRYRLDLPQVPLSDNGNYLYLRVNSKQSGRARLSYAGENGFEFDLTAAAQAQGYLIRVSTQYAWYTRQFEEMYLTTKGDIDLVCAAILPGD